MKELMHFIRMLSNKKRNLIIEQRTIDDVKEFGRVNSEILTLSAELDKLYAALDVLNKYDK